jgi:hypothetical protein
MLAAVAAGVLASCGGGGGGGSPPPDLTWRSASLPVPAGSRAVVRDAVWCGDRWWVVGGTSDNRGDTRPAVWTSGDGATWRRESVHPGDDYYAARAILGSIGCSADRVAALGSKSGGAHGNPRVQTWRELTGRSLAAVVASNEQYGGQDTVSVSRMSGGSSGYLVTGTRLAGAAVWSSRTGARFTLHDEAPGLASTASVSTQARDALWGEGSWTVVGDETLDSGRLAATVWSGAGDGPWSKASLPGGTVITTAERVTLSDAGPVVAGIEDRTFALWSEHDGRWSQTSTFGKEDLDGSEPEFVSGLASAGGRLAATYSDGSSFRLAVGPATALSTEPLPASVSDLGDHTVTVATHGNDLLLLTDDGHHGRVWLTHLPNAAVR